jgi:hypothetical protein
MKIISYKKLVLSFLIILLGRFISYSQCTRTTILSENFDDNTVTTNYTSGPPSNWYKLASLDAGQTKGDYAGCFYGKITNNAFPFAGGPNMWKKNTTVDGTVLPTGNDAGDDTDFALLVDGCSSIPNGSVWCTAVNVTAGEIYYFSTDYSSPWLQSASNNNPALYLTIDSVIISPQTIVEEYTSNGPTPYLQEACYYQIPAGTSGSVNFCINMDQVSGGVYGIANGQGNDLLLDNIKIERITGPGCPAAGTCISAQPTAVSIASDQNTTIRVFPNPSSEQISITFTENYHKVEVALSDYLGQQVFYKNYSGQAEILMDVSQHKPGIYFLEITTDSQTFNKKIIIGK